MNAMKTAEDERQVYFPGPRDLTISFLILLGIAAYFFFTHPDWSWGRIGSIVALVTVVLLLFRDWLRTYGEDFQNRRGGQAWNKVAARFVATAMTSIGAALLIIS